MIQHESRTTQYIAGYWDVIHQIWDKPAHRRTDWLELERHIREVLRDVDRKILLTDQAIPLIDEFLAAHTRRGNELTL